jgi:hypothetical protein
MDKEIDVVKNLLMDRLCISCAHGDCIPADPPDNWAVWCKKYCSAVNNVYNSCIRWEKSVKSVYGIGISGRGFGNLV